MTKPSAQIGVGSPAPNFTLKDADGTPYELRELLKEKSVVLIFYPGDMTPGCTMQLCAIRDDWSIFDKAGIAVLGVNHANAVSHAKFTKAYTFQFPLLIDEGMTVSEKYGAIKKIFKKKIISRTVVGIRKDGVIVFYRRGMPKDTEILKAFK
jgi:thioredoxin-dependent peroxiredoxin